MSPFHLPPSPQVPCALGCPEDLFTPLPGTPLPFSPRSRLAPTSCKGTFPIPSSPPLCFSKVEKASSVPNNMGLDAGATRNKWGPCPPRSLNQETGSCFSTGPGLVRKPRELWAPVEAPLPALETAEAHCCPMRTLGRRGISGPVQRPVWVRHSMGTGGIVEAGRGRPECSEQNRLQTTTETPCLHDTGSHK